MSNGLLMVVIFEPSRATYRGGCLMMLQASEIHTPESVKAFHETVGIGIAVSTSKRVCDLAFSHYMRLDTLATYTGTAELILAFIHTIEVLRHLCSWNLTLTKRLCDGTDAQFAPRQIRPRMMRDAVLWHYYVLNRPPSPHSYMLISLHLRYFISDRF